MVQDSREANGFCPDQGVIFLKKKKKKKKKKNTNEFLKDPMTVCVSGKTTI
jgi:hypothetical protein